LDKSIPTLKSFVHKAFTVLVQALATHKKHLVMKRLIVLSLILICLVNAQQAPMRPVVLSIGAERAYGYGEKLITAPTTVY
jgi:hypothetical protein